MTLDPARFFSGLSLKELHRINGSASQFEAAWSAGKNPTIEKYLAVADNRERPALFRELLLSELELLQGRGMQVDEATYQSRFPQYAEIIHAAFVESESDAGPLQEELAFLQRSSKPGSIGRLGHFEVLQAIGKGGFGIVLRAFDEILQRVVAIKVISPGLALTSPPRRRFLREARAAGGIHHDNVVQIYAVEEEPIPYIVMEYINGETLQQRLDRTGPLELPVVLRIGQLTANALAAAHACQLIHRDIKPSNILLESGVEQRVKVTDFGLARTADDASLTQSGTIAGTPMYMAPEQASGEVIDFRADLFSLGSVLYVMCVGYSPFRASSTVAVLKRVVEDTPRPIREIIPEVPQWLADLIGKLHAKDPADRFQTAKEVADLLGRYLAELQTLGHIRDVRKFEPLAPPWRRSRLSKAVGLRRRPWLTVLTVAGLLALAIIIVTDATGVTDTLHSFMRPASWQTTTVGNAKPNDDETTRNEKIAPQMASSPFDAAEARACQQAWAEYLEIPPIMTNSIGMQLALIPPGTFRMGSSDFERQRGGDEGPVHTVRLTRPFGMGVHPVTVGQFQLFVNDTGYRTEAEASGQGARVFKANSPELEMDPRADWHNPGFVQADDHPVVCINWNDAQAFCVWLSQKENKRYALPTEAQWEYACRAGSQKRYYFGDDERELADHAWYAANSGKKTHPVGEKKPNAWCLGDMHGNVWQWVADWHLSDYYSKSESDDPTGPSLADGRVLRGGDWNIGAEWCRDAFRGYLHPSIRNSNGGFRVVCEISQ